jgi:hypothetical protein
MALAMCNKHGSRVPTTPACMHARSHKAHHGCHPSTPAVSSHETAPALPGAPSQQAAHTNRQRGKGPPSAVVDASARHQPGSIAAAKPCNTPTHWQTGRSACLDRQAGRQTDRRIVHRRPNASSQASGSTQSWPGAPSLPVQTRHQHQKSDIRQPAACWGGGPSTPHAPHTRHGWRKREDAASSSRTLSGPHTTLYTALVATLCWQHTLVLCAAARQTSTSPKNHTRLHCSGTRSTAGRLAIYTRSSWLQPRRI